MKTTFAGVKLEIPVVNAAGTCKTVEEVEEFAKTPVGAITVGSITVEPRELNPGDTYWMDPGGRYSLNSLGLPNGGMPYYKEALPKMRRIAEAAGKPLIVSVAGFSPVEYAQLMMEANRWAEIIELNLGCPNVWGEEGQKPIASYSPSLVREILGAIGSSFDTPVTLKLSPLPPNTLEEVVNEIHNLAGDVPVRGVVASNTFPNGFGWNNDRPAITPGGGLAGLAGPSLYGVAIGQVMQLRRGFDELGLSHLDVMGTGGVQHGSDVQGYLRAGAKAVGVNTAFSNRGYRVFSDILMEFASLAAP